MTKRQQPERRTGPMRRQVNEAFLGGDGRASIGKWLAISAQIVLLYHLGLDFTLLIQHWESFSAVLVILVAPDVFKKLIAMKYAK